MILKKLSLFSRKKASSREPDDTIVMILHFTYPYVFSFFFNAMIVAVVSTTYVRTYTYQNKLKIK